MNSSIGRATQLGLLILWLLACVLALLRLGDLPLRDFDEGTVARVAFELSQRRGTDGILPTIWDLEYLNKPPGLHWLIAAAIQFSNKGSSTFQQLPSEFVLRLVPALLSTLVVPLGGLIQWQLRPKDCLASLSTAAILLTLLPVVRHGRLAMLDGSQLSAMALLWLLLLALDGSQMDRWRAFGIGLVSSFMLLMKAPLLIPAAMAGLIPLLLDGESRRFVHWSTTGWLIIGVLPGISWHIWNGLQRGAGALLLWWGDGAGRVLFDAGSGSDLGWRVPVLEMLEGGWPWLLLWPIAVLWAWRERQSRWGRWALGSQAVLTMAILPLKTQLPWYNHPLWLPVALLCGPLLACLISRDTPRRVLGERFLVRIPILWMGLGMLLSVLGLIGVSGIFMIIRPYSYIALAAGIGWGIGGRLLSGQDKFQRAWGGISLVTGSFVALAILMASPLWLWELNEHWPVKPVAELASIAEVSELAIDTSFERPSLNWYAGKRVRPVISAQKARGILTRDPKSFLMSSSNQQCKSADKRGEWTLLLCSPNKFSEL